MLAGRVDRLGVGHESYVGRGPDREGCRRRPASGPPRRRDRLLSELCVRAAAEVPRAQLSHAAAILAAQEEGATQSDLHDAIAEAIADTYFRQAGGGRAGLEVKFADVEWLNIAF
ncbi:hypothetical protein GCM10010359_01730 [Streptomyces morookaense]|nr:hypothetical protein GCM10010359_01730 [Streptomyces morookaense]